YLTRSRDVAEELTAETFERALRQWRRFEPRRGSAKTWLCRVARSPAPDPFRAGERRRRRERAYAADRPSEVEDGLLVGLSPELERAVGGLSARGAGGGHLRILSYPV